MTTHTGKVWTNSHVYSVLKRYKERVGRIENIRNNPSDVTYSKFEMTFERVTHFRTNSVKITE